MALDPEERPRNGDALVLELDRLRVAHAPTSFLDGPDGSVPSSALGLPDRPSLAVQPFRAGGGTDDDALFAEGVSEDILTALSRFKQLFVISQTSMLGSVARDSDVLRVGCVLGVRYVVQGNVRRGGGRLRISAKLVDAQTGEQLWDHRYDREPSDLFALQDEITRHVVASVAAHVEVAHGERARKSPPHALLAYDWLARGRAYHHRRTLEDNQRSRECLDRAVEIDPECAQAHAWRACAYGQALMMGVPLGESAATSLMHSLHRALALDDTDAECQRMACELAFDDGDLVKAEYHHARAIALNPNDARIVAQAGELATYSGDLDEARDHLLLAARLDPLSPKSYLRLLARVQYLRGDLDDAWRLLHCLGATQPAMLALRAAVAALRGDLDDARALRERVIAAAPNWSASASVLPFADPARRATWLAGFEAADRAAASELSAPPAPRPASRGRRS
jgi:adenylate cyclase